MKTRLSIAVLLCLFFTSTTASAATISSAKPYMPSTKYTYKVYDRYAYPQKHTSFKCKKTSTSHLNCARKGGVYTYYVTKKRFTFNDGGDTPIITPYVFPMTKGKTYTKTGYEGMSSYRYSYKVMATNTKKKVGNRTYKNVIKIRNNYDKGYTFIAKNHGVILITTKSKGKQVAIYKIKSYR